MDTFTGGRGNGSAVASGVETDDGLAARLPTSGLQSTADLDVPCGGGEPCDGGEASVVLPPRLASTLLVSLAEHAELDGLTLRYHVEQWEATARAGFWHAAVNEARSFVEALLVNIAAVEAVRRKESISGVTHGVDSSSAYYAARKYVVTVGFANVDEIEVFRQIYSMASRRGSHPGITDPTWGILVSEFCWITGHYLLERYAAWKANGRKWPGSETGSSDPRGPHRWGRIASCWRWLLTCGQKDGVAASQLPLRGLLKR